MRFSLRILLPALLLLLPAAASSSQQPNRRSVVCTARGSGRCVQQPTSWDNSHPASPAAPAPPGAPTALPPAESLAEGQATIYRHRIDKVIGERSSLTI
jgi:hypothetical protein